MYFRGRLVHSHFRQDQIAFLGLGRVLIWYFLLALVLARLQELQVFYCHQIYENFGATIGTVQRRNQHLNDLLTALRVSRLARNVLQVSELETRLPRLRARRIILITNIHLEVLIALLELLLDLQGAPPLPPSRPTLV